MIELFLKSSEEGKFLCESYSSSSDWTIVYIGVFFTSFILFVLITVFFAIFINKEQEKDWSRKITNTKSFWVYVVVVVTCLIVYIPYKLYSDIKGLPSLWKCDAGVFYDLSMFTVPIVFIAGSLTGIITLFVIKNIRK